MCYQGLSSSQGIEQSFLRLSVKIVSSRMYQGSETAMKNKHINITGPSLKTQVRLLTLIENFLLTKEDNFLEMFFLSQYPSTLVSEETSIIFVLDMFSSRISRI